MHTSAVRTTAKHMPTESDTEYAVRARRGQGAGEYLVSVLQSTQAFREPFQTESLDGLTGPRHQFGNCLFPLIRPNDLLFMDDEREPGDGNLVVVRWRPSWREQYLEKFGSDCSIKILKYVEGEPWLICRYGGCQLKADDKILGVVRAIRPASEMTNSFACWLENGVRRSAAWLPFAAVMGLIIGDECTQFDVDNVRILNGAGVGVRCINNAIWSTPRLKIGSIRNSQIAGNTGAGISLANTRSVLVENCRLGYSTLYDSQAETTQTNGVGALTTGRGVVCRGNFVTTSGGATAYSILGEGDRGCAIENAHGTITTTGSWKIDGIVPYAEASIADAAHAVNTSNKYIGKVIWDSSNTRLLRAAGTTATSNWEDVASGAGGITPA